MSTEKTSAPVVRVGVAVFVWRNGTFLIGQRKGTHGFNTWCPPGGHLELGESWEECAKREVLEETGMRIKNVRFLTATNDIFESGKHYITIWTTADWDSIKPHITEPDKYIAQEWVTFQGLPSPLFEPCWQNLSAAKPELFT